MLYTMTVKVWDGSKKVQVTTVRNLTEEQIEVSRRDHRENASPGSVIDIRVKVQK